MKGLEPWGEDHEDNDDLPNFYPVCESNSIVSYFHIGKYVFHNIDAGHHKMDGSSLSDLTSQPQWKKVYKYENVERPSLIKFILNHYSNIMEPNPVEHEGGKLIFGGHIVAGSTDYGYLYIYESKTMTFDEQIDYFCQKNAISIDICVVFKVSLNTQYGIKSNTYIPSAKEVIHNFDLLRKEYTSKLIETVTDAKLKLIQGLNSNYTYRSPFPHLVADNLFPKEVIEAVAKEIPDSPKVTDKNCVIGSQQCFNTPNLEFKKNAFDNEQYFGPATLSMFKFLRSTIFIQFLEQLTGIQDLIPDPEYQGSGIHQTLSGGQLQIHADFNRYSKYDMHRRVNVFIYLNPDWEESYGGDLELWSRDMKVCNVKIAPLMNRFVAFTSNDFSYHGHPHPLSCPSNRSRRSLALYYYTKTRPAEDCLNQDCSSSHTTLFQKTPGMT